MDTKIRIDLQQGVVEAEGSEAFVKSVYADFKEAIIRGDREPTPPPRKTPKKEPGNKTPAAKKTGTVKRGRPTLVTDLNLGSAKGQDSLKAEYAKHKYASNQERNALFVYYLQHKRGVEEIGQNHVYTCYKDVGAKIPTALPQSLRDTASTTGYIDVSSMDAITVTPRGENFVEHDIKPAE